MKRFVVIAAAVAFVLAACTNDEPRTDDEPDQPIRIASLVSFDACGDQLAWLKKEALDRVGPYGLQGGMYGGGIASMGDDMAVARESGDAAAAPRAMAGDGDAGAAAGTEDTAASTAPTGTNNQEAGVDEADQVKTDGRRIVAIRDDRLVVVEIDGEAPTEVGSVDLDLWGGQLFLEGDRAFVYGNADGAVPMRGRPGMASDVVADMSYPAGGGATQIVEVDLANGATVVGRRTVEGTVTAGRLANGVVRLVVTSSPPAVSNLVYPQSEGGEHAAEAANRDAIEQSSIEDWLPAELAEDGTPTPLVKCSDMYHPSEFAGFATLTVLSIPDGLDSMTATGMVGEAGVTYASPTALYVATTRYPEWSGEAQPDASAVEHTDVHRFDIATSGNAVYQGSGRVDGGVLNQYALSEHEGALRIATTLNPAFARDGASTSQLAVLKLEGDRLNEIGKVTGLGPTERIQGVRYLGDRGYVVTFRQTDPLYVIDLADPTAPKVLGELKVTGFSAYLHPVAPGRLLGVGVEANDDGRQQGSKVALYDTSDDTNPRELDKVVLQSGWFNAGSDPHAFTWDAERSIATIIGTWYDQGTSVQGAIMFRVEGDRLVEVGRIVHDADLVIDPVAPTTTTTTTTSTTSTTVPSTTTPPTTVPETTTTVDSPEETDGGGTSSSPGSAGMTEPAPAPDVARDVIVEPSGSMISPVERTLLAGGRLWALSSRALSGHDPATGVVQAWLGWNR